MLRRIVDTIGVFFPLALALVVIAHAAGAPAPLPRRESRAEVMPSNCIMVWGAASYRATFTRDGSYYSAGPSGSAIQWVGTWRIHGRTLTIVERYVGWHESPRLTYEIDLEPCRRRGVIRCGGAFRLEVTHERTEADTNPDPQGAGQQARGRQGQAGRGNLPAGEQTHMPRMVER